jgi:glutathione S-transferase
MKLYGTITSPFVRRVRVVAEEVGLAVERVDTATEAGMAALREVTPIRKVPVAVIDGRTLFDSRVIIEWLTTTRGYGALAPPADRWREANLVNAVDAAIDSAIQVFYLRRDGVPAEGSVYEKRQMDRVDAIFEWLSGELAADGHSDRPTFGDGFSLPEISVIAALDWMEFRKAYPTERAPKLLALRAAWADRASIAGTRPQ